MKNSIINSLYSTQTIIVFSIVWFKSGVWWHGLIGIIIHLIISGFLEGLTRGKYNSRYPRYFYISALILLVYYFVF